MKLHPLEIAVIAPQEVIPCNKRNRSYYARRWRAIEVLLLVGYS